MSTETQCTCHACIKRHDLKDESGFPLNMTRMIVCPVCGDKRCVHAKDHEAPCAKANIYEHNAWVERNLLFAPPNVSLEGRGTVKPDKSA